MSQFKFNEQTMIQAKLSFEKGTTRENVEQNLKKYAKRYYKESPILHLSVHPTRPKGLIVVYSQKFLDENPKFKVKE